MTAALSPLATSADAWGANTGLPQGTALLSAGRGDPAPSLPRHQEAGKPFSGHLVNSSFLLFSLRERFHFKYSFCCGFIGRLQLFCELLLLPHRRTWWASDSWDAGGFPCIRPRSLTSHSCGPVLRRRVSCTPSPFRQSRAWCLGSGTGPICPFGGRLLVSSGQSLWRKRVGAGVWCVLAGGAHRRTEPETDAYASVTRAHFLGLCPGLKFIIHFGAWETKIPSNSRNNTDRQGTGILLKSLQTDIMFPVTPSGT